MGGASSPVEYISPAELAERIRDALRCDRPGCACRRPTGNVHCLTHDDPSSSLSVTAKDGKVMWCCFAGCEQDRVRDALVERGLWSPSGQTVRQNGHSPHAPRERRWEIRDPETSRVLATHVRRDLPPDSETGSKKKKVHWEPSGVRTAELPLYRAERLAGAETAIVCEGEPATDAAVLLLANEAAVAVVGTVTGASSLPSDAQLSRLLPVPTVVLWGDADEPGRAHMDKIAARLVALGHRDVRVMDPWPEATDGRDAADLLAGGATPGAVVELVGSAIPYRPDAESFLPLLGTMFRQKAFCRSERPANLRRAHPPSRTGSSSATRRREP